MEKKGGPLGDIFKKKIETNSNFFTEVWKPKVGEENQSNIPHILKDKKCKSKNDGKNCLTVQEVFDNGFNDAESDFLPACSYGDDQKEYINDFESLTSVKASEMPPFRFLIFATIPRHEEGCDTCQRILEKSNTSSQDSKTHIMQHFPQQPEMGMLFSMLGLGKSSKLEEQKDLKRLEEPLRPPPKPPRTQLKFSTSHNSYFDSPTSSISNKDSMENMENTNPPKTDSGRKETLDKNSNDAVHHHQTSSDQTDTSCSFSFSLKFSTSQPEADEYLSGPSSSIDTKNTGVCSPDPMCSSEITHGTPNKESNEQQLGENKEHYFTHDEGDHEFYSSGLSSDSLSSNTFFNTFDFEDTSENESGEGSKATSRQSSTEYTDLLDKASRQSPTDCTDIENKTSRQSSTDHSKLSGQSSTDHTDKEDTFYQDQAGEHLNESHEPDLIPDAYQCYMCDSQTHQHACCRCNQFTKNQHMLYNLANSENLEIHDVVPDGNCMFRAIVDQMRMQGEITLTSNQIRQMAVKYLQENPLQEDGTHLKDFFVADGETWEQYLQRMTRDGEWGDQIILRGLSEVIKREICIISTIGDGHNQTSIVPKGPDKDYRKIYLGHVNDQHYYSLRPRGWQNTWYREARKIRISHHKEKPMKLGGEDPPVEMDLTYPCRPSKLINCSTQYYDLYGHVPIYHLNFVIQNVIQAKNLMTPRLYYGDNIVTENFRSTFECVGSAEEDLAVNLYTINLQSLQGIGNTDFNSQKVTCYPNFYKMVGKHDVVYPSDSYELGSDVILMDYKKTNPGYTRLCLCKNHQEVWVKEINDVKYLWSEKYTSKDKNRPEYEDQQKKNCIEPFQKMSSILFYYNKCPRWPEDTNEWKTRQRPSGWPDKALVNKLLTMPCVLTPRSHPFSEYPEIEWMFDFSFPERLLLKENISKEQRYCFHVFKILIDFHTGRMKQLSTFILKTIFLYTLEVIPGKQWETCPSACVLYMIETLLQSLKERRIPHYFIPRNNIIEHITGEVIYKLTEKVNIVREFPMMSIIIMAESHGVMTTCITDQIIEDINSKNRNSQDSVLHTFIPAYMKMVSSSLAVQSFRQSADAAVNGYKMLQDSFSPDSNPYEHMSLFQFIQNATSEMPLFQTWWLCFFVDLYYNENTLSSFVTTSAQYRKIGDLLDNCLPGDFDDIPIPNYVLRNTEGSIFNVDLGFLMQLCTFLMKEQQYMQTAHYLRGLVQKVTKFIENPETYTQGFLQNQGIMAGKTSYVMQTTITSLYSSLFWILQSLYVCYIHLGQTEYFQEYIEQFEIVCDNIASYSSYDALAAAWKALGNRKKMKEAFVKRKNVRE